LAISLESVRKLALSLPETTEEPHHEFGSFRVRGKIFVTIPPGGELLHIFLPDQERELALAMDPEFLEPVRWGGKVLGVRAKLPLARASAVKQLVRQAYAYKAASAPSRRTRSAGGAA
jgi:YjbR